jgi:MOSC domain-containing protein YiiM
MLERAELRAIAGVGIEGDRYATTSGYWSFNPRYVSEITFVEAETIARVAAALGAPFSARESRRNVVTQGVSLDTLIGRRFAIGEAMFEGLRACDPCAYLDDLVGLPVRAQLEGRGGLRASILLGGTIRLAASIVAGPCATPLQ